MSLHLLNSKIPPDFFKRQKIIIRLCIFFLCIIFSYIAYLQILKGEYYKNKSIKNYTKYTKVNAIRGTITDIHGTVIASTKPIIQLYWNNTSNKEYTDDDIYLINFLKEYCEIDILNILNNQSNTLLHNPKKILISDNTPFKILCMIVEKFPETSRISIETTQKRVYPFENSSCHLIGYINTIQENGISGIEKIYNNILQGKQGVCEKIINATGYTMQEKIIESASHGNKIHTTLDIQMQLALEKSFPENIKGCAIIMNPENGDIKAMLSSPRFNPSLFLDKIDDEIWNNLIEEKTLINRCTQGLYPPASTFKYITAIAALEEKFITEETTWYCYGHIEYKGKRYHCHNKNGHGAVNISKALVYSCNIPFYSIAIQGFSIDNIHKYATQFGFGNYTGFILPEQKGLVPSRQWKKKIYGEKWYLGETLSVAIGQGATLVTPIQIARSFGSIFMGYMVNPRIIKETPIQKESVYISSHTKNIIKAALKNATIHGTALTLKFIPEWEIYAKTGTAQLKKISRDQNDKIIEEQNELLKHHGEIVCFAWHPKVGYLIIYLLMENVGSSSVNVRYLKKFFMEYSKNIR